MSARGAIITEPGRYTTRNGKTVEIFRIDDPRRATANCKGHWPKTSRSGRTTHIYDIWCPDGRYLFVGEHPLDIVARATTAV